MSLKGDDWMQRRSLPREKVLDVVENSYEEVHARDEGGEHDVGLAVWRVQTMNNFRSKLAVLKINAASE